MSTRTLSANEPSRSSADWDKKDATVLKESPSVQDPYPQAYAEEDLFEEGAVDAVYQAKARVLNAAVREIGMGRYQVRRWCSTPRKVLTRMLRSAQIRYDESIVPEK